MTDERFARLPKWAQEHIRTVEGEREAAVKALQQFTDDQTPGPFIFEEWVSDGQSAGPTTHRRYVHAHRMAVIHAGVEMEIVLHDPNESGRRGQGYIWISYAQHKRTVTGDVMFQPASFQQARIFVPKGGE